MGEDPGAVFNVGCPSIDLVAQTELGLRHDSARRVRRRGRAGSIPSKPFVLMMQHPVTTEYGAGLEQINATLDAVASVGMQALVFWPNVDAGLRGGREGHPAVPRDGPRRSGFHFFRNLPAGDRSSG